MLLPLLLPLLAAAQARDAINYFDNTLAKACRPLDKNLDLMFLLDGSGSVSGNTFDTQIRMVKRVVEQVDVAMNATRIAILQYSGYTKTEVKFGSVTSNQELLEKLKGIRHISGTTRTGKALRRARNGFSESQGARIGDPTVAQVVVVVGDGHSLDNPIPASRELVERGIVLLTMGIGSYVNMNELVQMTNDPSLAFNNETMDEFISTFRRIAVGEVCDFAKGDNGAEIICNEDHIEVNIQMSKKFHGHVYVPNHFKDSECAAHGGNVDDRSVSLKVPLNGCGVQEQFMFSPRGLMAETSVVLMYHPEYNHPMDKTFTVRCFYPDMRYHGKEGQERKLLPHFSAESLKIEGNPLISSLPVPKMEMPCAYTLRPSDKTCVLEDAAVGDVLHHHWECDRSIIGEDYGFFIHSCFITDGQDQELLVLDNKGCPVDSDLFSEIKYDSKGLRADADGSFVKFADVAGIKFRCSVRFCNRVEGECDEFIPAKCGEEESDGESGILSRLKRQVNSSKMMKEMMDFMPPHMVERLFMRRQQKQQDESAKNNTSGEAAVDSFGRPILQKLPTTSTRRLGVPSIRSFRPIGQSVRNRQSINVTPKRITPTPRPSSTTPAATTAAVLADVDILAKALAESGATTEALEETTVTPTFQGEATTEAAIAELFGEDEKAEVDIKNKEAEAAFKEHQSEEILEVKVAATTAAPEPTTATAAKKMPIMAGSLSFDELIVDAINNFVEEEEKSEKEASTEAPELEVSETAKLPVAPQEDAIVEEIAESTTAQSVQTTEAEYYEDTTTVASTTIAPTTEKMATTADNIVAETTAIPTIQPKKSASASEELAEETEEVAEETTEEAATTTEAALISTDDLVSELRAVESEVAASDPELASVVSEIRAAVMEGEMGMELVGLAVDIVAGLQLGQVQLESQIVRVRDPPRALPSPLNFCPRSL